MAVRDALDASVGGRWGFIVLPLAFRAARPYCSLDYFGQCDVRALGLDQSLRLLVCASRVICASLRLSCAGLRLSCVA